MTGERVLARFKQRLARRGALLTVYRKPSAAGGSESSQSVRFIINAIDPKGIEKLRMNGILNANDANTKWFVCAGDANVKEATDQIVLGDWRYRLASVEPEYVADVAVHINCIGVREEV